MTTVKEMIKEYLIENGYDGLCTDDCGCLVDNLITCEDGSMTCEAGYKKKVNGSWIVTTVPDIKPKIYLGDDDFEDLEVGK